MNNKEAIEQLMWVQKRICDMTYSPESFEAINIAIEKLREERPQGKWIYHKDYIENCKYSCNQCGNLNNTPSNFCPNCGAEMTVLIVADMMKGEEQ